MFFKPTAEYRGTPFWAWNNRLEKEELIRQIDVMKEMGMGGFHMHSRVGLNTEYLSTEFMEMVKACTEKAKAENMLAWLYDEDRWPSGAAGGRVTKAHRYRSRYLMYVPDLPKMIDADRKYSSALSENAFTSEHETLAVHRTETTNKGSIEGFARSREVYEASLAKGIAMSGYWLAAHEITLKNGLLCEVKYYSDYETAAAFPQQSTDFFASEGRMERPEQVDTHSSNTRAASIKDIGDPVPIKLSEPNVLLLDIAAYCLDNGGWQEEEEVLRIDTRLRKELGFPLRMSAMVQPWAYL